MPGRTKACEGSLRRKTAQSCVPCGAQGLGTGLVLQANTAHCTGDSGQSLPAVISVPRGTAVA